VLLGGEEFCRTALPKPSLHATARVE